jgi:hypothetical protein
MIPYFTWSRATPVTTTQDVGDNQVGIYVGTTGNVTVTQPDGSSTTYNSMPVGAYPIICKRVTVAPANSLVLYE